MDKWRSDKTTDLPRLRAEIQKKLPRGFSGIVIYMAKYDEYVRGANEDAAREEAERAWVGISGTITMHFSEK